MIWSSFRWVVATAGLLVVLVAACTTPSQPRADYMQELEDRYRPKFVATLPEAYRTQSMNLSEGRFLAIDSSGKSSHDMPLRDMLDRFGRGYRIILVHGTMYNPEGNLLANPHLTIYEVMRQHLSRFDNISGIGWDSVSFTLTNLVEAWRNRRWTWYGLTDLNATRAAASLSDLVSGLRGPYALVCHSIGCDMVRQALSKSATKPSRILMLSPDTDYAAIYAWSVENRVPTRHVVAKRDTVLRFSRHAQRNAAFSPDPDQPYYRREIVDIDAFVRDEPRLSSDYGNVRRYLDHMAVLELSALWPGYVDFLTLGDRRSATP